MTCFISSFKLFQVSGMIKALPTTIRLSNGETQSVPWGLPETSKQRETMMVGHDLKHQTAVDVFIGNIILIIIYIRTFIKLSYLHCK